MTRTEVIQALAAQAEIPQIEAGKFMEIFLQKLALSMKDGEEFYLRSFGSFRLLKVKGDSITGPTHSVAIFHPEGIFGNQDDHVFRLPSSAFEVSNQLDLYFSLSINKPLIPTREDTAIRDSVPSSPLEFKKFAEFRADEIINLGEFRRSEFDESEMTAGQFLRSGIGASTSKEWNPHVTWEFGDDWKKEYEVESLLETETPEQGDEFQLAIAKQEPEVAEISWDFGGQIPAEEEKSVPDPPSAFSKVSPRTRELEIDLTEFQEPLPAQDDDTAAMPEESGPDEDFDALFRKSMAENVLSALPLDMPSEPSDYERVRSTREIPDDITINLSESEEEQPELEHVDSIVLRPSHGKKQQEEKKVAATGIRGIIETGRRTSRSLGWFWKTVFAAAFFAGCIFVYNRLYGKPEWFIKAKDWVEVTLNLRAPEKAPENVPLIIERDYDIPVAYPYPLSQQPGMAKNTGDSVVSSENLRLEKNTRLPFQQKPAAVAPQKAASPTVAPRKADSAAFSPPRSKETAQEPKIITGGSKTIQVMSVKTQADAETEVNKLRQKGYDASYYKVDLGSKGIWYRVTRKGN